MKNITIAIDGYSSCGKSTLARALAHKINYRYVDIGAMYRFVTLHALRNGWIKENGEPDVDRIIQSLPHITVEFHVNPLTKVSETFLNKENVEREIRKMEVNKHVSRVSALKEVREKMVALQRKMGKNKAVVMDGRDIGTNVFPQAELKIFMTADQKVRAQRRHDELSSKGDYQELDVILQNLLSRDKEDMNRKENPLVQADDAIILDNTDLNREQQLEFVLKLISDLQVIKDEQKI